MSIKIYDAFRFKPGVDVHAWVAAVTTRVRRRALTKLMALAGDGKPTEVIDRVRALREKFRAQFFKYERDECDFRIELWLYPLRGRWYLRYGVGDGMRGILNGIVTEGKYLEDYHYQDQTDWPEGMTRQRWEARRRVWDAIMGFDNDDSFDTPRPCYFVKILAPEDDWPIFDLYGRLRTP